MNQNELILVLGGRGLVGSAIIRNLVLNGYQKIIHPTSEELDLMDQASTRAYFEKHKPKHVFLAAAKVGGIHANNTQRADFIFENLMIQNNVFESSFKNKVQKLLFLGSSCIYPKNAPQPLKEEYLLSSALEPTNEPYAIAKIAGLKTAEAFRKQYGLHYISVMPTNIYGINDNFDPMNSHVIPGLIARMQKAIDKNESTFKVWGSGEPKREFLYVDDLADACRIVLEKSDNVPDIINIGQGDDIRIYDLAHKIKDIMNFKGELVFDKSMPDGTMRKILDSSKIFSFGWKPKVTLDEGLKKSIHFYQSLN